MPFRSAWLIVGPFLVLVGFSAAQPPIAGVGFVIILIGGVSRFWSRHLFDRVELKRTLVARRVFAGESVGLDVEMVNRKPLPLPWFEWRLAVVEQIMVEGEALAAAVAPGLSWIVRKGAMGWYQRQKWQFRLASGDRGYHLIGPGKIRSADLLGIFPGEHEDRDRIPLTVFPRVFALEELGLPADHPFGDRKGRNPVFEDPLRIGGLREYRPGDPLRRIDWKATARTGDLQSRVYEPSATQQIYIMLNIDTMPHAWEGYLKDELERAVSTAASIAVWAAGARFAVGLLANGSFPDADRPIRLAPSRSRDQLTRVLEALAVIQPLTMGDLAGAIQRESGRLPAGSTVVVVASLIPEPLAGAITRLQDEGNRVYIVATSPRAAQSAPPGVPVHSLGSRFGRSAVMA